MQSPLRKDYYNSVPTEIIGGIAVHMRCRQNAKSAQVEIHKVRVRVYVVIFYFLFIFFSVFTNREEYGPKSISMLTKKLRSSNKVDKSVTKTFKF